MAVLSVLQSCVLQVCAKCSSVKRTSSLENLNPTTDPKLLFTTVGGNSIDCQCISCAPSAQLRTVTYYARITACSHSCMCHSNISWAHAASQWVLMLKAEGLSCTPHALGAGLHPPWPPPPPLPILMKEVIKRAWGRIAITHHLMCSPKCVQDECRA